MTNRPEQASGELGRDKWALVIAITSVLGLILAISSIVYHSGGDTASMKQWQADVQRQLDQKEDRGTAEAEHQAVMNMLNAVETQQSRLIEIVTDRRGK